MHDLWRMRAIGVLLISLALAPPAEAMSVRELQYLEDPNTHAILHALPARDPESTRNVRRDECSAREDLTGPGRLAAAAIGETIRKAGTRIDHVVAGPRCNAALTARLLKLVPVDIVSWLDAAQAEGAAEQAEEAVFYLAGLRPLETALLVAQGQLIAELTAAETVPGELLIVRVSPVGAVELLYRIEP